MKTSELITLLQEAKDKYGDLEVEDRNADLADGQTGWKIVPIDECNLIDDDNPLMIGLEHTYD